jgi:hypothetical protein
MGLYALLLTLLHGILGDTHSDGVVVAPEAARVHKKGISQHPAGVGWPVVASLAGSWCVVCSSSSSSLAAAFRHQKLPARATIRCRSKSKKNVCACGTNGCDSYAGWPGGKQTAALIYDWTRKPRACSLLIPLHIATQKIFIQY